MPPPEPAGARIEAAGGLLWRPAQAGAGVEVALVHRPAYDDWSLPKGKLRAGEHPVLGALREVAEETGQRATPGRPLGESHYLKDGRPKRVRYWALAAGGGTFAAGAEVDEVCWLQPQDARGLLAAERDRPVLDRFLLDPPASWPCVLVRHASAGERAAWPGPDAQRPLDPTGIRQAEALARVLAAYSPECIVSADVRRCLDTVRPLAARASAPIKEETLFSETGYDADPGAAYDRLVEIVAGRRPAVVCSQGGALPGLIAASCRSLGWAVHGVPALAKGGYWILHFAGGERLRLVGVEDCPPPGA